MGKDFDLKAQVFSTQCIYILEFKYLTLTPTNVGAISALPFALHLASYSIRAEISVLESSSPNLPTGPSWLQ